MKGIFGLLFVSIALSFCNVDSNKSSINSQVTISNQKRFHLDTLKTFFGDEINLFGFRLIEADSLIFFQNRAFDTCSILIISRNANSYEGKYFYYPPTYYKQIPETDRFPFIYKAINFKLTIPQWEMLVRRIENGLTPQYSNAEFGLGIIHPEHFKFYFKNEFYSSRPGLQCNFDHVYNILQTQIIDKLLKFYPTVNGNIP